MENTEMQSTFEEKVNIEDLVLPSNPTGFLNAETIDIKKEPLEQGIKNTVSIHESKTGILNMNTKDMKEEPLEQSSYNTIPIHESKTGILNMNTKDIKEDPLKQSSNTISIHGSSKSIMLPTMPIPMETIQSAENGHFKSFANKTHSDIKQHKKSVHNSANNIVVGSNPCNTPIATLSIRDLRLGGTSFIRSHASKHGLPNASRKQMKDVIGLLKSHYEAVHQVSMLKDDFGYGPWAEIGAGGGKVTNSSQGAMALPPFQVQMALQQTQQPQHQQRQQHQQNQQQQHQQHHRGVGGHVGSPCSAKILAHSKSELTSFGTALLRPEAAAHKVPNSSRKPKHVVIDELWGHYKQCHSHKIMNFTDNSESGCIGNVVEDNDEN